jgi:predicted transcriptional regulator
MTKGKVREVIEIYREIFVREKVEKIDYPHSEIVVDEKSILGHCHGMLDKMVQFVEEGRMEKVFRWLGFV